MPDKVDQLYDALKADGAVSKSRENFRSYMLAPGKEGYNNRLQLYKALNADGAVQSKTYEEFRDKLGIGAVNPQRKQQASAAIGGNNMTNWANPVDVSTARMSAWERERQPKTTAETPVSAHTGNGKPQKVKTQVQQQAEDLNKAMAGDEEAAERSGLATAVQRMKEEKEYYDATGKPLRNIVPNPLTAPTAVRDENGNMLMGQTTDEQRVAQYRQVERDDARKALDKALKEADKGLESRTLMALDESKKEREENPLMFALSHMGQQSSDVYQQGQERMMNQGISPEALWEAVNRDGYLEKILNDDELVSRGAAAEGMDKDEYIQKVLAPQIADHYDKYLSEKFDIKGFGDYAMQRALGSVTGTILSGAVTTKKQREMRSAAIQRANEGLGSYKPGVLGRLGGEVAMFVPDATILAMTGVFGEKAATAVGGGISWLGNKLKQEGLVTLGQVASSGSPFLAANVGRMTKWTGLTLNRAASGTGLGAFMGTSAAIQDLSVGDGSLASVGKAFLSGFGEGTATGALLGVTNLGAQTAAGNIAGNTAKAKLGRAGMFGTAFVAENQLFANMDRFREDDFDWVDSSADAFYMQLAGKVSSRHSLAESMKGVERLFTGKAYTEKAKTGLSWQSDGFRLDDNERSEIERAFGGTKLEDVAVNPDNVGKILNDKEAISWKTRQKVAGSMGMLEPSRPRTDRILVMDKMIDERAEDNELIETHTFNTEEEKQAIIQRINEKRDNNDMLADYDILRTIKVQEPNEVEIASVADRMLEDNPSLRPEDVAEGGKSYDIVVDQARDEFNTAKRVIMDFAHEYGMYSEEVEDIMKKDPVERTDEEYELMNELASRLHAAAHPKGEYHPTQSRIDGRKVAGSEGTVAPEAAEGVAQEKRDADEAYYKYLNSHEEMRRAVESLGDARPDEVYMYIYNNYSGTERDEFLPILADRINAQAKQEGFIAKVGENIEDTVRQEVDRYSFKGTVDEAEDTDNIVTFTHNGYEYTMLNGQIGTRREPGLIDGVEVQKVDPDKSGDMIIALDEDNNWVFLKPDANMQLSYESKADFSARRSEELGVQNTQNLVEAGVVRPEEETPSFLQEGDMERWPDVKKWLDENPDAKVAQLQREFGIGFNRANRYLEEWRNGASEEVQGGTNADVEAGGENTGADEASATAPIEGEETLNNVTGDNNEPQNDVSLQPKVATSEENGIPLSKNGKTKLYHRVEPDVAIDDILQQPTSKFVKGNNDPNAVADRRIKSAEERLSGLDKKLKKRFEEQNFTDEEAEDLVSYENGGTPRTEMGKYVASRTEIEGEIDYYKKLKGVWQQRKIAEAEEARRKANEAALKSKEEQPKTDEAEQRDERFKANREKFEQSKEDGDEDTIVLANGETIEGRYVLVDADAVTPSHNPRGDFAKSEGFPVDENGKTINDRDYENDKNAQVLVQKRSQAYDQRAVNTPVVVSEDGIVLSGNDRTMSGQMAADNGTDGAYVDYITKHAKKWGFTSEQVSAKKNPRIVFVPNEKMPYNAETFAKFNQDEKKSQSKLESSVKLGKVLATKPQTLGRIGSIIDQVENLGDLYSDAELTKQVLLAMREGDLITDEGIARLTDENGLLSAQGKDEFETMLAGVVVDEDALRILNNPANNLGDLRKSIAYAVVPLVKNQTLGDYSIVKDVSEAIRLYDSARKAGLVGKDGDITNYFINKDAFDGAPMDAHSLAQLMIANQMSKGGFHMKRIIEAYNSDAQGAASGQVDMWTGGIRSKEDILTDILKSKGYDAETIKERVERLRAAEPPVERDSEGGERGEDAAESRTGEGDAEPERRDEQVDDYEDVYVSYRPSDKVKELEDKAGELSQQHYDKQIEGRVLWSRRRKLERELKGKRGKKREEIEAQLAELDKEIAALDKELERLDEAQTEANEEWEEAEGKELSEHMKKLSDEDLVKLLMEKEGWEQEGNDWYLEDHEYNAAVGELSNRGIDDAKEAEIRKKLKAETDSKPEGGVEPEQRVETKTEGEEKPAEKEDGKETVEEKKKDEYLEPRNDKEKEIISDVEKKLAEEIKAAEDEVRKAKSALEKAQGKESDKATDMFSDDEAFREKGQLFDFEDMPTDRSKEGVEKRTQSEREQLLDAQEKLNKLQSEAERNSRIRGALDEERRQTSIDDKSESQPTGKPATDPMAKIEETAKEFQKEQDKQIGITHEETPVQKAQAEGEKMLTEEPLTEEDINNTSLSNVQKTWAKAYLKGKTDNELYLQAYLEAKEDVRNQRQNNEANRSDAGSGTQLAGSDDNGERRPDRVGSQTGGVDTGADVSTERSERPEQGRVSGVEDSTDNVARTDGERGDNSVLGQESELDGVSARGEQSEGSRTSGSRGRDVRQPGSGRQSDGLAEQPGQRDIKARRSELKSKRDELLAKLAEARKNKRLGGDDTLKVQLPVPSIIPTSKEERAVFWELATTTAEYGYTYLEEGITKFNEWKNKVYEDFVEPIKDFFGWGQNEVDRYIEQVWNSDYEINGVTRTMSEWASLLEPKKLREVVGNDLKTKFEQQKAAESVEVKTGDIDNIRESLPYLLPEQQDDVLKAETQFFDESHQDRTHGNGKGIMFTNGTGTGKTYTGLGIVKRFVKQGKGRVLIITPSQEKVTDWANDGLNLGLQIEKLDDVAKVTGTTATKSKGKGVVVTTYANARQNLALLEDCFDLIVYDESHKITEGKEAAEGEMFKFHQMLTNKNVERSMDRQTYWLPEWIEHRNLLKESEVNRERLEELEGIDTEEAIEERHRINARMTEIANRFEELRPIMQEIRESKRPQAEIDSKVTKTVFLSATPFNRRENLKYAEGYLFSYPEEDMDTKGTYNHRSPEDAFLEQMFPAGYRWRYGRLEQHVSNADALGRQEIDFSDYLQNQLGTMSGRMIASDYDYSRDFPVLTLDNAGRFNQAMSEVYRNRKYQPLAEIMRKVWNYNDATSLFEAMKTSLVNDRIKEHLARGQKVVVFHRRRTSREIAYPFERAMDAAREVAAMEQDKNTKEKLLQAVKDFESDFRDIFEWEKTIDYTLPREQIEKRFGKDKVAFFSGAETKNVKHKSVEDFMKDNGGKDIIVIQEASGKEGISLHDQTGEHQRVEINLALPQSPIAFIQIEGRIYRIGQKSNAIFEYPLLGLDLETNLFAQQFNNALGTTENLALGSKARNLRKSIANSVLENTGEVDYDRQGLGGKDMDGRVAGSNGKDGFDVSIQDYYGNQKMKKGRDNREGVDYFPTPEPVGYKMVEWAQMLDGETALEPSAGHGAIARYVPETNGMTAIEPSASLFTKLQMRAGGPGRRFEEMTFEDYPLANKHDVILMNPPYGVGGKTAMEHVAKAFRHLNEGGRIVAIIPDGPSMEKRLNDWLNSKTHGTTSGIDGSAVVVGEVKLPSIAFGRAGTNVMTRIVVIDKVTRAEMRKNVPEKVTVDLSNEDTIGGLFDRIRNVRMPERTIDQVAINTKKAMRTKSAIEENPFARGFNIMGNLLMISNRSRYDLSNININLENPNVDYIISRYKELKKVMDDPSKLDYGRWENMTFGRGKNATPAVDAIRDYCEKVIKTLENVSGMTADQMDKAIKQQEEARLQREREEQERKERERQERIEKGRVAVDNLRNEFKDDNELPYLESLITKAHAGTWSSFNAKETLKAKGVDWETGKKIITPKTVLRESYNEKMPLDLDTMESLMDIAENSIDARRKDAAKRALEMSGIHSDTGKEKENFDYSSHDEYYEKDLREFLQTAGGAFSRLMTKQQKAENDEMYKKLEAEAKAKNEARKSSSGFEYKLDKNTRTDEDMHLVTMNNRLSDEEYKAVERKAKALNGYYNRFKKAWHFKTEEDARKFMENVNASNGNDGSPTTRFRKREAQNPVEADFERKRKAGEKVAKSLNMDFEAVTDKSQIKNREVLDAIAAGEEPTGWIEIGKDGKKKIFLYLPNVRDTYEAEKTIAHETIGHYGLRELLGEKGYKDYMRSLLFDLKDEKLKKYWQENLARNGFDTYRTIDEYLADAAEKGYGDLSMWQKVKEKFTDALRKAGFSTSPSISDVKYMIWLSKYNLEKGNTMNDIRRSALLHRLERERYKAKVSNGEYSYDEAPRESNAPYFPGEGKTLFRHTPSVKNQRRNYERSLHRIGYVWKEAHIDAMQSAVELVKAMTGVKKIEDIPSAENFILLENQMSSKEEQMDFLFNRDYMKPLDEAVAQCLPDMGGDIDRQLRNLQLYMIKKHGLERNRVLFVRDKIRELRNDSSADQNQVNAMEQDYIDLVKNLRDDLRKGIIDLREYFEETDRWIRQNLDTSYKAGDKDYSGLTDIYGKGFNDSDIIDDVMSTEDMLGEERVGNLWEKTKAVSQFGLDMEYEGGLDSKEKHDKVSEMFEWYVPLRGYNEKTAEEAYDYLEEHDNTRKWAGPVLMNAKGRESLSDVDVFATLGSMNSYAINRALRNQMKQAFARFVRNHYKDVAASDRLVTELPNIWVEKQFDPAGNEIWVEKFPDIPENAKADDIANILEQYQQDMKAKQAKGDAKRIRQRSNIPYRNTNAENKAQHIVDVWINGEKHAFVINGNPRAAQAINGQLKAERNSNILWMSSLSHFMAKMNTSYSPDFIVRNTERDFVYSAANIAIKENAGYWLKWAKNYAVATGRAAFGVPAMHTNLFKRYREGKLNMSNETDRYFKEFMENGGETGWVERKNLDKWKEEIKKGVQKKKVTAEEIGDAMLLNLRPVIEAMNERAENLARFATYMTSRQSGRSIVRSVSDAKEVSVNFNRKGAGSKTVGIYKGGANNALPDWLNSANAYMAGWSAQNFQDYIMFYNAGVQGLNNMVKSVRNNPIKGSTAFAFFAMAALLMPRLNKFLFEEDDDKTGDEPENPYAELPEYVRRNNLCIYMNKGSFATFALPIELRAMYGIGDMAAGYLTNPELRSTKNMGEDIVTQLSQIMPINFMEGGEFSLWNLAPSGAVPFLEAGRNKNWLGQPIERDETQWNENKPRWTRAFKNVGDVYVGASKRLNAATNPYGDENIKGWADGAITDPALVEHVINGYFGGVGSTVNRVAQLAKNAKDMSAGEILSSNWTPIARTMHYTPNERTRFARTRNKWWHYKEEMDKTQEAIKALRNQGKRDPISFMRSVSEEEGKKGTRAMIMQAAYKSYNKIKKKFDNTDDLQEKNIYQLRMDKIMEEAVKELDKIK